MATDGLIEMNSVEDILDNIKRLYGQIQCPSAYFYRALMNRANDYCKRKGLEKKAMETLQTIVEEDQAMARVGDLFRKILRPELSKREMLLFEWRYGTSPRLKLRQIAALWGLSDGYVRQYAAKLNDKIMQIMRVHQEEIRDELADLMRRPPNRSPRTRGHGSRGDTQSLNDG